MDGKAKRILVWGTGEIYDKCVNILWAGVRNGEIEILALISRDCNYSECDGREVITSRSIHSYEFDYILVCVGDKFHEVVKEAEKLGIQREKLISYRVLEVPGFTFRKYFKIKDSDISIISDDCWGGVLYHRLDLPFRSPFINFQIPEEDYLLLLENLQSFVEGSMGEEKGAAANLMEPRGVLTNDRGEKIRCHFYHYSSFEDARQCWMKRKSRVNWDNLFIKMTIYNEKSIERFLALPFPHKAAFYHQQVEHKEIIYLREWQDEKVRFKYGYNWGMFSRHTALGSAIHMSGSCNLIDMLAGEADFTRKK